MRKSEAGRIPLPQRSADRVRHTSSRPCHRVMQGGESLRRKSTIMVFYSVWKWGWIAAKLLAASMAS